MRSEIRIFHKCRGATEDGEASRKGWRCEQVLLVLRPTHPGRERVLADLFPAHFIAERWIAMTDTVLVQRDDPSPPLAVPALGARTNVAKRPCNPERDST